MSAVGRGLGGSPRLAGGLLAALALLFAGAHAPYLSTGVEDIDSANFALGLRDYDIARHQPHPPGYPVYIAIGRVAAGVLRMVAPDTAPEQLEARALAQVSLGAALLAVPLLLVLFSAIDGRATADDRRPLVAALLTISTPLYWYMAARPMSDLPGLTAALGAQVLLVLAWARQRSVTGTLPSRESRVASGRLILLGALAAGVAIGFRSQVAWMTLPLLCLVLADRIGRGAAPALLGALVAASVGALAWAVPMVAASGGPGAYLAALGAQGGEDFAGVDMLALHASPRTVALALVRSLVFPWDSYALATVMLGLAAVGFATLLRYDRRGALVIAVLAGPYAVFHLLFHDTSFVRYALPLVPAVAYLGSCGLGAIARHAAPVAAAGIAAWAIGIAQPVLVAYGDDDAPTARALQAMRVEGSRTPPGALMAHHVFKRTLELTDPTYAPRLPIEPRREWLEVVRYWRENPGRSLWLLADPRRTDLVLFDPSALADRTEFGWETASLSGLGGMRPSDVVWYRMRAPGWMLAEGWALSPETAGTAERSGHAPYRGGSTGYIARAGAIRLMVGGRHLGAPESPEASFVLDLDGEPAVSWTSGPGAFLHFFDLPAEALSGAGSYATMTVRSESGAHAGIPTAIEQFDAQPDTRLVWGYGEGWHEPELNPSTGRSWRWTSGRAVIETRGARGETTVAFAGVAPLKELAARPTVIVRAGTQEIARLAPAGAFEALAIVPAGALAASGQITIETDRVFVPAERHDSADRRQLGLQITRVEVAEPRQKRESPGTRPFGSR